MFDRIFIFAVKIYQEKLQYFYQSLCNNFFGNKVFKKKYFSISFRKKGLREKFKVVFLQKTCKIFLEIQKLAQTRNFISLKKSTWSTATETTWF